VFVTSVGGVGAVLSMGDKEGSVASNMAGSSDLRTNLWPDPQGTHWTCPDIAGSGRYSPLDIKVCRMRPILVARRSAISAGEGGIGQTVEAMIGRGWCVADVEVGRSARGRMWNLGRHRCLYTVAHMGGSKFMATNPRRVQGVTWSIGGQTVSVRT
jgi:hypothetical protein